jgi:hypothetical protein
MKKLALALFTVFLFVPVVWGAEGGKLSQTEEYDLSERCGQRAEEFFKANNPELPDYLYESEGSERVYSYENHYNRKMNICFIMIEGSYSKQNSSEDSKVSMSLYDVNQHKNIAAFSGQNEKTQLCKVLSASCDSEAEWETLIEPYMKE